MKKIILFDTSSGSANLGDYIIFEAIERELAFLLQKFFCVRLSTHQPLARTMSNILPIFIKNECKKADYKFLCGTNLFVDNLMHPNASWSVNAVDYLRYEGCIAVGCGMQGRGRKVNGYSRHLYKKMLSHSAIHSVRDERTANFLSDMGVKVLNTGCPSVWQLNQGDIDAAYAKPPSPAVIFTLTDYNRDPKEDVWLVDQLRSRYERVLLWPQGSGDYEYAKSLEILPQVELISPNLAAYQRTLEGDVDYIGTRLHGGIAALCAGRRALIVAVDHRATDMGATCGLPVVRRGDHSSITATTDALCTPKLTIPRTAIQKWKAQFMPV